LKKRVCRWFCGVAAVAALLDSAPAILAEADAPIRVALYDDNGAFGKGVPRISEILAQAGGFQVTIFKAADTAGGLLENKEVVIFTGGSGSKQGNALGDAGREAVKKFVEAGGGYLGICGGAYLACSKFPWALGLLDAQTVSPKWRRGAGQVQIEMTALGQQLTTLPATARDIRYDNGPILRPAGRTDLAPYEPLAIFRTEVAENGTPVGAMVNSPAMVRGRFGKGRVLISSPHPEQTPGMESAVEHAVRWLARGGQP
jgi:putative intracellular protease/amidase